MLTYCSPITVRPTVGEPDPIQLSCTPTDVTTKGGNNGSISITITDGAEPFRIGFQGNTLTPISGRSTAFNGLTAGEYIIEVMDGNNCTAVCTTTVAEPTCGEIDIIIEEETNPSCNGAEDGSITVSGQGGTPPYTPTWIGLSRPESANALRQENLRKGTYQVSLKDALGCTSPVTTIVLGEPAVFTVVGDVRDAICGGDATGRIGLTATGGSQNYTYTWSPNTTTTGSTATGLSAGDYTITISDGSCPDLVRTYRVDEPDAVALACQPTSPTRIGGTNGKITINITNGTAPFRVGQTGANLGSPQSTRSPEITGLGAGDYTIRVVDANGCEQTCATTIEDPVCGTITVSPLPPSEPSCNGGMDGSITVTATGGVAPYTASWSGPGVSNTSALTQTGLGAGTYTVTVTDSRGCTPAAPTSITLNQPEEIAITSQVIDVLCKGEATGSISLTVTGESNTFTYAWSDGAAAGAMRSGLTAGDYEVTVTSGSCSPVSEFFTVTEPAEAIALGVTVTSEPSCFGIEDASIRITATGGTGSLNLRLNNLPISNLERNGLAAGEYTLSATDQNGCPEQIEFIIGTPTELILTCDNTAVTTNGGNDGTVTINVTGGTVGYSYNINEEGFTPLSSIPFTIEDRSSGDYEIVVRDANGCEKTCTGTIAEPACGSLAFEPFQTIDPLCAGGTNGSFSIEATGGVTPYTYTLNGVLSAGGLITGQTAGDYTVKVADAVNCETTTTVTLTDPAPINVTCSATPISMVGANDGTITVVVENATGPLTVSLDEEIIPSAAQSSPITIGGRAPGTYLVSVTDANQCSANCEVTVNDINCPELEFQLTPTSPSCADGNDGIITITPNGLTNTFTYSSDAGPIANGILANLRAGEYEITATDRNGCKSSRTATVVDPAPFGLTCMGSATTTSVSTDGTIQLTFTAGTPPYNITVNGDDDYAPIATDLTTLQGLASGTYDIEAVSADGCTTTCSTVVTSPACVDITLAPTSTNPQCSGATDGSITINASGGTGPLTVTVNGAEQTGNVVENLGDGDYLIEVTDAVTCRTSRTITLVEPDELILFCEGTPEQTANGGDGSIIVRFTNGNAPYSVFLNDALITSTVDLETTLTQIMAGEYTVVVEDANGCRATCSTTVGGLDCPDELDFPITSSNPSCFSSMDGFIFLETNALGSAIQYFYSGEQIEDTLFSLGAGDYLIEAVSANGCTDQTTITLVDPIPFSIECSATDVSANLGADGTITVSLPADLGPYEVVFDGRESFSTTDTLLTFSGLSAGEYTTVVTSASECITSCTESVGQPLCSTFDLGATTNNPNCAGGNDGSISLNPPAPATNQYTVTVNGDPIGGLTIANLTAGEYVVAVTDQSNCTTTETFTLVDPAPFGPRPFCNVTCEAPPLVAIGGQTTVTLTIAGGLGAFNVQHPNGPDVQTELRMVELPNYGAGTYEVVVNSFNGCTDTCTVTVNPVTCPEFNISLNAESPNCTDGDDGRIVVSTNAPDGALTFTANDEPFSGNTFETASAIFYTIEGIGSEGCTYSDTITVPQTATPFMVECTSGDIVGQGAENGEVALNFVDGAAPLSSHLRYRYVHRSIGYHLRRACPG